MNSDDWKPIHSNEKRYGRELEAFIEEYMPWTIQGGPFPALLLPEANAELIADAARSIAERMLASVVRTNATSWRKSAQGTPEGRRIYAMLRTDMQGPLGQRVRELVDRQVKLIEKLPDQLNREVQKFVGREQRRGVRASKIAGALEQKLPQLRRSQVRMLARTEVGRAESALTQARSERLGLRFYEWESSHDQRVRPAHQKISGVLVAWSDPPNPERLFGEKSSTGHYHPGATYNCRCLSLPLVSLDEVTWPHRVYSHGQINYVSRGVFERWIQRDIAA